MELFVGGTLAHASLLCFICVATSLGGGIYSSLGTVDFGNNVEPINAALN